MFAGGLSPGGIGPGSVKRDSDNRCPAPAGPPALSENYQPPSTGSTVLSLRANSRTASVCGELEDGSTTNTLLRLSVWPYIEDGVLYIPLEEVLRILGGSCQVEGDTATAVLHDTTAVYQAGQPKVRIQRGEYTSTDTATAYTFYTPDHTGNENAVPVVKGDCFYIPLDFIHSLTTHRGDPESNSAQIGSFYGDWNFGFYSVAGSGGRLEDFPTQGLKRGEVAAVLEMYGYSARCYEGNGLTLYVTEELPNMGGGSLERKICGILCTQRGTATPRGLQVGDTLDWARFLYGPLTDLGDGLYENINSGDPKVYVEAEDGIVTSIGIYNIYWAPQRFVEETIRQYEAEKAQEQP